jgi:hypothetical protein
VWKKALVANAQGGDSSTSGDISESEKPLHASSPNQDLAEKLRGKTPEVFTIGDGSKVYQLAQDYTAAYLAQKAAKDEEAAVDAQNFVHVFLDVPANKSGERPHQALINFQSNKSRTEKSPKIHESTNDGSVIVKIQRAAPLSPADTAQQPMLLYDQSRTLKTFVHLDPDDDGYEKIAMMIAEKGMDGALGQNGGTKAYFFGRLTKRKKGPNILSIQVAELASAQDW